MLTQIFRHGKFKPIGLDDVVNYHRVTGSRAFHHLAQRSDRRIRAASQTVRYPGRGRDCIGRRGLRLGSGQFRRRVADCARLQTARLLYPGRSLRRDFDSLGISDFSLGHGILLSSDPADRWPPNREHGGLRIDRRRKLATLVPPLHCG